ncbi:MAG TPA: hypothetical protein VIH21_04480 [Dehalococcoidia bacterium]|jgi:hypothetical protein
MAEGITADFVILADSAQVQGEKLYMLGGGWSAVWAKEFPTQHQMSVAAGILIPWMETNQKHEFKLQIRTEDQTVLGEIAGNFEQGRPAGLPAGSTQRVMLALNVTVRLERASDAQAELWLDGVVAKSVPFRIVQRPR